MLDPWVWQRGEEMSLKKLSLVLAAFLLIGLFLVITASPLYWIAARRGERCARDAAGCFLGWNRAQGQ